MIPITVQNQDRNISARDYAPLGDQILVTTMFRTLQGEGPYAGYPAIFLRLAGCNYGSKTDMCTWCDTSFSFDKGTMYEPSELLDALTALPGYNPKDILVVTGGEPTLQLNLLNLIVKAHGHFAYVQIETNGTQPKFFEEATSRDMNHSHMSVVVSPKANMRLHKYPPLAKEVQRWASCLKFVISSDESSAHHEVPDWALTFAHQGRRPVYVSPMAIYKKPYAGEVSSIWDAELVDQKATAANYAYAAEYVMKHNLRLSLQTHLFTAIP